MDEVVDRLKSLADHTRWRIVSVLLDHDLCVGSLAKTIGVSESAVSQHLRVLRSVGLVTGEKRGYWTHYAVNRSVLITTGQQLVELAADRVRDRCPATEICSRCDQKEEN